MARITIEDTLYEEIKEFCSLNELKPQEYVGELLKKAFLVDKYGEAPPFFKKKSVENIPVAPETSNIETIKVETEIKKEEEPKAEVQQKTEVEEQQEPVKKVNPKKEQARKKIEYL